MEGITKKRGGEKKNTNKQTKNKRCRRGFDYCDVRSLCDTLWKLMRKYAEHIYELF